MLTHCISFCQVLQSKIKERNGDGGEEGERKKIKKKQGAKSKTYQKLFCFSSYNFKDQPYF